MSACFKLRSSASAGGGNTLVKATRAFGVLLNLSTGDSTTALIELESGAAGTLDPTINTSCDWQLAIYRTNCHAESASETCTIACGAGRDSEGIDRPPDNHLGRNLDYSGKAAFVQSTFPIRPTGSYKRLRLRKRR